MKFMKGDEDNLEGKVIVYSKYSGEDETISLIPGLPSAELKNGQIFAVYNTIDPVEFMQKMEIPESMIESYVKDFEEQIKNNIPKEHQKRIVTSFMAPISVESEADLLIGSEDVLFAGDYSSPMACLEAYTLGLRYYMLRFIDQVNRKTGINITEKPEKAPAVTYKDIKEDFDVYLVKNFVVPMIDAVNYNEEHKFKEFQQDFVDFSSGSGFVMDVINLCQEIKNNPKKHNMKLIEAYVGKIAAIHTEKYEVAGEMRDLIAELNKSNS